jgi:putative spermidine/putrescine transport system ATP-binding protein
MTHADTQGHRLDIEGVSLSYGGTRIVDQVTLAVQPGELVALLGPSGCGKTTLLRAIAGFMRPDSGRILFDGKAVDHLPPGRRRVGIVFQNYALFPHMSVAENVAYGLHARRVAKAALAAVQMVGFAARRPSQLSGGQQQRVSLARAIVTEPAVLLLDEPFAALDRALRLDLQLEIKRLQRRLGLTAVMVTHDQDEAMSMADRMAVMRAGRLEQLDAPEAVYDAPANRFVAGFVGASVEIPGCVTGVSGNQCDVMLDGGARLTVMGLPPAGQGGRVVVSARPEHLALFDQPASDRMMADLRQSAPLAGNIVYDISVGGLAMKVIEPRRSAIRAPGQVYVGLAASARPALFAANEPIPGSHT